jgi:hypothetical protein
MAIVESHPGTIKVYKPVAEPKAEEKLLASRPVSIAGKVIGFLNNSKDQVDIFLDEIAAALRDQNIDFKPMQYRKLYASYAAPFIDEVVDQCDLVINGIGD